MYSVRIICLYIIILLKVVGYYDLSVLSMSVMGLKKKPIWMGVGGWGELYPSFFLIFLTLQRLLSSIYFAVHFSSSAYSRIL